MLDYVRVINFLLLLIIIIIIIITCKCHVVFHSVTSVCKSLCNALTFKSLHLESSFWNVDTYAGQVSISKSSDPG